MGVGRQALGTIGGYLQLSADGAPLAKAGGITIDWDTVAAVSGSDVTLNDGRVIKVGEKFLRYGQTVVKMTGGEINTLTLAGGASGDTFTLTVGGETTAAIAYDANAAAIDAALELLDTVGTGGVTVSGTTPNFVLTFAPALGDVTVSGTGTGMTATIATTNVGGRDGMVGPFDPAAIDGRQTLVRGRAWVLNRTALEVEPMDDYAEAIEGGRIWRARLIQSEAATHTLADGPTFAEILATFPGFTFVE